MDMSLHEVINKNLSVLTNTSHEIADINQLWPSSVIS